LVAAVIGGRSCSTMRAHLRFVAHGPEPSDTPPAHPQVFPELGLSRLWPGLALLQGAGPP